MLFEIFLGNFLKLFTGNFTIEIKNYKTYLLRLRGYRVLRHIVNCARSSATKRTKSHKKVFYIYQGEWKTPHYTPYSQPPTTFSLNFLKFSRINSNLFSWWNLNKRDYSSLIDFFKLFFSIRQAVWIGLYNHRLLIIFISCWPVWNG